MTTVSFPGLGIYLNIKNLAFSIGSINVYWYGIIVTSGIILASLYIYKKASSFNIDPDKSIDFVMYSVIFGVIGARLYYVAFKWEDYKDNLSDIFKIWNGGIAFYGGIIGGILCVIVLCKIYRYNFLDISDLIMPSLLLGQGIGRWGNFVNVEAFGSYYTGLFRMTSPKVDSYMHYNYPEFANMSEIPVHPTFLYESIWLLLGFLLISLFYTKRRSFKGELSLRYLSWNGFGRFFIEGLRTDSLYWGNIRVSQALAFVICIISCAIIIFKFYRYKKKLLDKEEAI